VTLSGFSVTGASAAVYAGPGAGSQGLTVFNLGLSGNGRGVSLDTSNDNARIYHSTVQGSTQEAGTYVGAAGATISGNTVFANGWGIQTTGPRVTITDNVTHHNQFGGIAVYGGRRGVIRGNDVYANVNSTSSGALHASAAGVSAVGEERLLVIGNRVHDNLGDGLVAYGGQTLGEQEPRSEDAGEIHVESNLVHGNAGIGITLLGLSDARFNVVYENNDGIAQAPTYLVPGWRPPVTIADNRVSNTATSASGQSRAARCGQRRAATGSVTANGQTSGWPYVRTPQDPLRGNIFNNVI
jgi:parallel beta-helix repeat protein